MTEAQESLLQSIQRLELEHDVHFSYDPDLINGVSELFTLKPLTLDSFIHLVSTKHPFRVNKVGDAYYSLVTREAQFSLSLSDGLDDSKIPEEIDVYVLLNGSQLVSSRTGNEVTFSYKPILSDTLEIYALGFDRKRIPVTDLFTGLQKAVSLPMSTISLKGLTIQDYLTKGIDMEPSSQSIRVKVSDLPLIPGETDGDIFASIAALPGITTPDGRAGNLFIRGSETDQTLVLFDNIPMYHRGHYYGTISPYNPKMVDNVRVFRSGFDAGIGDRVGGAVLIESSQNVQDKSIYGAGANSLFSMAYAKMAISPSFSLSIGGRHSWGENASSPKLNAISESIFDATAADGPDGNYLGNGQVLFRDYHLRANAQLSDKSRIAVSGIYTNTHVTIDPIISPEGEAVEQSGFFNIGASASWEYDLSQKWKSTTGLIVSKYDFRNATDVNIADHPMLIAENILKDFGIRQNVEKQLTNGALSFGMDLKWQEVAFDYRDINQPMQPLVVISQADRANTFAGYASHSLNWKKWFVNYGLRASYYDRLQDWRIAPRVLLNFEPWTGWVLKSSYGNYNQFLSQIRNLEFGSGGFDNELWRLADGKEVEVMSGRQFMGGFVYHTKKAVLDVEYFVKDVQNITLYEERRLSIPGDYFSLDQVTYGVDVMLKRSIGKSTSMWLGYSFHDSKIQLDTAQQFTYQSKFVQSHVLYLGSSVVKERWKLSAGWRFGTGLNSQSLDIVYAEVLFHRNNQNLPPGQEPPPSPFEGRSSRYNAMHFLDISASYLISKTDSRKWNASLGLSLINLLNQKNLTDQVFRGRQGFIDRYAVGFAPNLMLIIEW